MREVGWDGPSSAPRLLQVGQYVSRAEELKAIVSSSNQALLRQGTSARDLLRGRPGSWPRPPAASHQPEGEATWGGLPEMKNRLLSSPCALALIPEMARDKPRLLAALDVASAAMAKVCAQCKGSWWGRKSPGHDPK